MLNSLSIFAGLDRTGAIRFVGDVPRGAACGCICSSCGGPLIAKRGELNKWHFAHEASQERPDCFAGSVNLLRRLAIDSLRERTQLELPVFRQSVMTEPPLPVFLEIIEWNPGLGRLLSCEIKPSRSQSVALLELASGTRIRLFVQAGSLGVIRLPEVDPIEGSLLLFVPLPSDSAVLGDRASATKYIDEAGVYEWHRFPDAAPLIAETLQQLEQRAKARANVKDEVAALHRIASRQTSLQPDFKASNQPRASLSDDPSPWSAWRKPRSSFIFYGLSDGSAWLLMQHIDGRPVLVPWPKADDGWDEQLPARLGVPDLALGGVVLSSEVNAMIYLRGRTKAIRSSGDWTEILEAAIPFRS